MHKHVLLQYSDILYLRVKLNIKWGEITGLYIIACIVKVDIILQNGGCLEDEGLKRGICHMSRKDVLKVFQLWFWWLQRQMSKECVINRVKSAFMLALNRFMFLPMPNRFYNSTLAHILYIPCFCPYSHRSRFFHSWFSFETVFPSIK